MGQADPKPPLGLAPRDHLAFRLRIDGVDEGSGEFGMGEPDDVDLRALDGLAIVEDPTG